MNKISELEIKEIITKLEKGEEVPIEYKSKIFPDRQQEYELIYGGKMRKEDVLSNEDGVFPVPLQLNKTFQVKEEFEDGWSNILVYGDNLQFLKTIYEDKDPYITQKVKGKVKMIYIDPPFATESDFVSGNGQMAYTDKVKGAQFVEFLRRRLIVAKEILAPDGVIYVHLDWKKVHYIKIIMDEIFGERYFKNEIIWKYFGPTSTKKNYPRKHDVILFYSKSDEYYFDSNAILIDYDPKAIKRYDKVDKDGNRYKSYFNEDGTERRAYMKEGKPTEVFEVPFVQGTSKERIGYPTQKPEALIARLIQASTKEGDLVLDFFSGSGTTLAVAEKLNRKWIGCDIGKLSYYTIQKRLLSITKSKDLFEEKKIYKSPCKKFITLNTGFYDLRKILELKQDDFKSFVMNLFEIEDLKNKKINGIKIDGIRKDGYYALIYPFWKHKDSAINEEYLENLHANIGESVGDRIYLIAPVNYVDFFSDYYQIGKVRYYFLKVPYQIIKELHKINFKRIKQPQSVNQLNSVEDVIGFHFTRKPIVESNMTIENKKVSIRIDKFYSDFDDEYSAKEMCNFESLSMVLIDKNYNGENFNLDEYYFAKDIIKCGNKEDDNIKEILKLQKALYIPDISINECGEYIMIIYIDVYGNEFIETREVK